MGDVVLVTGATGFTGGHLARRLATEGKRVRTIARDPEKARPLREAGVQVVHGDLADPETAGKAMPDVGLVYHIAALYRQEKGPEAFWATNVAGTERLLAAARDQGVTRFVHCSTVGVQGDIAGPPAKEERPYQPGDAYQESKTEGERVALRYRNEGPMEVTVVRPSGIYGPGDLRFLKLFRAIARRRFVMIGNGNVFYHLTYIDDLVDGILRCGTRAEAAGRTYTLAGAEPVTLNRLVGLIADAVGARPPKRRVPVWPVYAAAAACEAVCRPLGIEPPLYRRRVDFFTKSRAFDIGRARRELGFEPKVDLPTGLRRTAEWYREHGYL